MPDTWSTKWELWPCSGGQIWGFSACGPNEVVSVGWLYTITVPQLLWFQQGDWHFGHLHPSFSQDKNTAAVQTALEQPDTPLKKQRPFHSLARSPELFLISSMHGCRWDWCGLHLSFKPGTGTCARVLHIMALCEQREETFLEIRWVILKKKAKRLEAIT